MGGTAWKDRDAKPGSQKNVIDPSQLTVGPDFQSCKKIMAIAGRWTEPRLLVAEPLNQTDILLSHPARLASPSIQQGHRREDLAEDHIQIALLLSI